MIKPAKSIKFRKTLFWDVDIKTIDPGEHARYIIERIVDFGNDGEVKWMWRTYSSSLIREVVKKSRGLQPQSKPLWLALTKQK